MVKINTIVTMQVSRDIALSTTLDVDQTWILVRLAMTGE